MPPLRHNVTTSLLPFAFCTTPSPEPPQSRQMLLGLPAQQLVRGGGICGGGRPLSGRHL